MGPGPRRASAAGVTGDEGECRCLTPWTKPTMPPPRAPAANMHTPIASASGTKSLTMRETKSPTATAAVSIAAGARLPPIARMALCPGKRRPTFSPVACTGKNACRRSAYSRPCGRAARCVRTQRIDGASTWLRAPCAPHAAVAWRGWCACRASWRAPRASCLWGASSLLAFSLPWWAPPVRSLRPFLAASCGPTWRRTRPRDSLRVRSRRRPRRTARTSPWGDGQA
jgi:hypothetical protein